MGINMQENDLQYLNALCLMPYLGPVRIKTLRSFFSSWKEAWHASFSELQQVDGWFNYVEKFTADRKKIDVVKEWEKLCQAKIEVLEEGDSRYPLNLSEIHCPPPLLYTKGSSDFSNNAVALVGSRKCTHYGREIAINLAGELAMLGITVVSGMALGIDSCAHKGALEGGGFTVAVLGCGLDTCYPPRNYSLMEEIIAKGAVVSEFPLGVTPIPANFPRRNRIISGMTLGTVVIEAMEKSGALITANFALEQGREVFAIPGNINSPFSKGCNRLIRQGAVLVEKIDDILVELGILLSSGLSISAKPNDTKRTDLPVPEKKLLEEIPYQPIHADELLRLCTHSPAELNSLLLNLELKGLIRQSAGKFFCRV